MDAARILDESGQCERRGISRKIKELLADKIKEGKITAKWIHDVLPSEYKREYKRELTSLSASNTKNMDSRPDGTVIVQGFDGNAIDENDDNNDQSLDDKEETKKTVMDVEGIHPEGRNLAKIPSALFSTTGYNSIANTENVLKPDLECSSCKELYSENLELKAALTKSTQLVTADNISSSCSLSTNFSCTSSPDKLQSDDDTTYHIPKGKHDLLIAAMQNSREFCSVKFDKNRILVHAEPDISREMTND